MTHKVTEAQAELTEQLVSQLLGRQARRQAVAQSLHTLRHHRFAGVNWHEVRRRYAGLAEKFSVHALHSESRSVQQLLDCFLAAGHFDEETQHSLLALLLELSNSPVADALLRPLHDDPLAGLLTPQPADDADDVDWRRLLVEDLGDFVKKDYREVDDDAAWPATDDESGDSQADEAAPGDGEGDGEDADAAVRAVDERLRQRQLELQQRDDMEAAADLQRRSAEEAKEQESTSCRRRLRRRLQAAYWLSGRPPANQDEGERWSHLRADWLSCAYNNNDNDDDDDDDKSLGQSRAEVTQYQAVRETIWMLAGSAGSTVYRVDVNDRRLAECRVAPSGRVCMPQLTDTALDCALLRLADLGSKTLRLRRLCQRLVCTSACVAEARAFAYCLHSLLQAFDCTLTRLESSARRPCGSPSLLRLSRDLRPWRLAIDNAHSVAASCLWLDADAASDPGVAARLLDCLHLQANCCRSQSLPPLYRSFLADAFAACLRPALADANSLLAGQSEASRDQRRPIGDCLPRPLRPALPDLHTAAEAVRLLRLVAERRDMPQLWRRVFVPGDLFADCLPPAPTGAQAAQNAAGHCPVDLDTVLQDIDNEKELLRRSVQKLWPQQQQQQQQQQEQQERRQREPQEIVDSVLRVLLARCQLVNRLAVQACLADLQFEQFTQFVLDVCLMMRRDLLAPLCRLLLSRLAAGQLSADELSLNLSLRACVADSQFANCVWLTLAEPRPQESGLALLDSLTLHCEPPWPLGQLADEHCLRVYADSFRWLLKLRCAKEMLERLRYSGLRLADGEPDSLRRRVHCLRASLLHMVNAFHQFTAHRLAGEPLLHDLAQCQSLPQLLAAHRRFADKCGHVCLLDERAARIRQTMGQVFRLALGFARQWPDARLGLAGVDSLQRQLAASRQFFAAFFASFAKSAAPVPHLESLVLAMSDA